MIRIKFENIELGMVIGEDIYNDFDVMVVSSGSVITKGIYRLIENMDLFDVAIVDKNDEETKKAPIVKDNVQKVYDKTVESFKKLFNTAKIGKQIVAEEVADILSPMLNEIMNNPSLAKKLWQIEASDEYTYDHSVTVSMASALLGKWMNLSEKEINDLATAGLLHDIGKCNIPDEILNKPDQLTDDEFKVMKTHATLGYLLIKASKEYNDGIISGIYQHHERYDGNGYPNKLVGDDIHLYGRIIAVADVYSAMTSNRVYRKKMSPFLVAKLITEYSFGYLDPVAVNVFLKNVSNFYIGTQVKLTNGEVGEVVMINKVEPYRPLVKVNDNYIDLTINHDIDIESVIE